MTDLSPEQKQIASEVEHIFKNLAAVAVAKELKSGAVEIFKLAKKLKKEGKLGLKFDQVREIIDVNFDEAKAPTRITENSFFESFNRTLPHIDNLSKDSLYLGHIYPGIFSTQTVPLTSSDLDLMRGVWKREVEHTSMRSKGDEKEIAKALKHFEFKPETEVEVLSSAKDVQKKTAGKNK